MARTKASVGSKVSSGKSSKARCSAPPPPSTSGASGSSAGSSRSYSGGNTVCPRETPKWQRPITNFFINKDTRDSDSDGAEASISTTKPKRNVIQSDDEEDLPTPVKGTEETTAVVNEPPKNQVLDETIELEPLTGEDSHKIEEYYPKNGAKGKGVGKKAKKENVDSNNRRNSIKRNLDEITAYDETNNGSKKVKVN